MEFFWLIWFGLVIWVGVAASNKGRSGIGWGILAFIFSPLLAGVAVACLKDLTVAEDVKKVQMEHQHLKDRVVLNEKITEHRLNNVENDVNKLSNNQHGATNIGSTLQAKLIGDGTKLCPACAETIKEAAIKCKHCGVMLSDLLTIECPFCSEIINASDRRCLHCKSDLLTA